MSSRPLVAVTCYLDRASWRAWNDVPALVLHQSYVDRLRDAGADVVVVPPGPVPDRLLDVIDGIVLTGGPDVDPSRYGQPKHPTTDPADPLRDETEISLVRAALEARRPVLGICRGMQVMAVATGGTLIQHLPERVGHDEHAAAPGRFGRHPVRIVPGSRLQEILGDEIDVPTLHHQGVVTHPGFRVAAQAEDGTVEAIEKPDHPFCIGVQWHPEADTDLRLFTAFVAATRTAGVTRDVTTPSHPTTTS